MPLMKWTPTSDQARRIIMKYEFGPPNYTQDVNKSDVKFLLAYPGETYTLLEKVEGIDTEEILGHKPDPPHVPALFKDEPAAPPDKPGMVIPAPATKAKDGG